MTNPGDSDEWWKQYGGEGVSPDSPSSGSNPIQPTPPPTGYSSAPDLQKHPHTPPPQPQYPNYPPSQPNPVQQNPAGGYPPPAPAPAYGQPAGGYQTPGYQQPGYQQPGYQQPGAYPQPGAYQPYGYQQQPMGTNGMAIASLIVSILGLSTMLFCFLPIGSLVGLILGAVGLNQVKQSGQDGRGLALGGIWVGAAGLAIGVVLWVFVGAAIIGGSA
ncbi:DUF4190 domain-containing protein [Nocardia crassostreae]|uniref:DUF4190 domain-containing protein n=1 Tax=Nocardia crassostreae TaxID=53428 RepID=UPI00082F1B6D|nr:DUF4190 domain-containing protein [Nocardia crassostreae]